MTTRQLYQTCITAISDYDFEIWWNDQKSYAQKFQKLQNLKLRKILKTFKTENQNQYLINQNSTESKNQNWSYKSWN